MCIIGLSLRPIVPEFLRIGRQQSENLIFSPGDSYILKFGNYHLMLCHSLSIFTIVGRSDQFSSVTQSCPTLYNPMDCSTPGFPVYHQLPELAQTHVHQIGDTIQPSQSLLCLLLLPSIFRRIRVFFNESVLRIRWSEYWSFSFSISPSMNIQD